MRSVAIVLSLSLLVSAGCKRPTPGPNSEKKETKNFGYVNYDFSDFDAIADLVACGT